MGRFVAIGLLCAGFAWAAALPRIARAIATNEPRLEGDVLEDEEVAFDDGSRVRPWNGTHPRLLDYLTLSTGQRITNLRMERGDLSVDVTPRWRDSFTVTLPGAQFQFAGPARARIQAGDDGSIYSCVFAGEAIFYTEGVDLRVPRGKCLRANRKTPDRFAFEHEAEASLDWSAARIDELAVNGTWISTDTGTFWKPEAAAGWTPYRDGSWKWIERVGWTWIPSEAWGWKTSHYGTWSLHPEQGWLWRQTSDSFAPSGAHWLTAAGFVAWGPVTADDWGFAQSHLTVAEWRPGARKIDPKGFAAPVKDLLAALQPSAGPPPYGPSIGERDRGDGLLRFGILMPAEREAERPAAPAPSSAPVSRATPPTPVATPPEFTVGPTMIVPVAFAQEVVTVENRTTTYLAADYKGIVVYDPPVREDRRKTRTR